MKKIFLTLVVILAINTSFAQQSLTLNEHENLVWETSFDIAIQKSKIENKPVLVFFTGSDWCMPCKMVDEKLFNTAKFKGYSDDNLILYKADFPRNTDLVSQEAKKKNNKLQYRYGIDAFPTVVVVNAKGNVLGKKRGAYTPEYYYPFLENITRKYQ